MIVNKFILDSVNFVVNSSKEVKINRIGLKLLASNLRGLSLPDWNFDYQYKGTLTDTIQYYFLVDSINFCFWNVDKNRKWKVFDGEKWIGGYYALSLALKNQVIKNKDILKAEFWKQVSFTDFKNIIGGQGELLLLKERFLILKENFTILSEKFNGQAFNITERANKNANNIVELLVNNFPSFKDESEYLGKKVYFWKRAQIFVSDIDFGIGRNYISHLKDLTIFADYKLPQVLQEFGVLKYSEDLLDTIKRNKLIPKDTKEEIEIRANTIMACELLAKELSDLGRNIMVNELDWLLWVMSKERKMKIPYHKTLTTFY